MFLLLAFAGGLAGSLHCLGMCGGFPVALAASHSTGNVGRQVIYNLARLNTLVFIGAASGLAGSAVVAAGPARGLERSLAVVAGTLMVVIGLEMMGVLARVTAGTTARIQSLSRRLLGGALASRSPMAPVALGVFNALLPCQLIYAFAAQAASTASIVGGMATMLAFGLGTIPAMLALGTSRSLLGVTLRHRLSRLSAILVVAFGLLTIARGLDGLFGAGHAHLH